MLSIFDLIKTIKNATNETFKYFDRINDDSNERGKLKEEYLNELKRIRVLDQKCWSIFKEVFIYIVFLVVLFEVAFSNLSYSAMQYNFLFQNNFVERQSASEIGLNEVRFKIF